jgi:Ca-activated chloride channel family protein
MKRLMIPALILVALALGACGQSAGRLNNAGNEAFENQEYDAALLAYHQAGDESPELAEPHYNAANTHYRLEDYENALAQIEAALVSEESTEGLDQHSFFNLGNTFFQGQQFDTAIEAYKEALRLNPDDLEAKQNLELALRQMQQQQQDELQQQQDEQQQQQDEQQQDQQSEQQQDQQSEQQQDQQNEQQQDQQDEQQQEQQDEQQQDQQNTEGQPQEDQPQDAQANGQAQQVEGLTEEQARQLFEAAAQDTESLEEFLQQIYAFPMPPPAEDW